MSTDESGTCHAEDAMNELTVHSSSSYIAISDTTAGQAASASVYRRPAIAECSSWPLEEGVWWINRILVPEADRGQGLGSRLLQRLLTELKSKGAKAVIVAPGGYGSDPEDQFNFYRKNGFRQVDKDGLYRVDF